MATSDGPGYLRFFPYDQPYDHQRDAMETIREALVTERDVLFEGACGTGKTLAALAPALEYGRAANKTVVITTNVHQQTRQFIQEARAINDAEPLRAVVFRGKGSMCHIDVDYQECQALRDATREVVDQAEEVGALEQQAAELREAAGDGVSGSEASAPAAASGDLGEARAAVLDELSTAEDRLEEIQADANVCERYHRNLTQDTSEFYDWLYADVRTPDEIYEAAHEAGFCGYELLKEGMEGVDLVVCNYHHLLDPTIREQFFRWLDRDPEDIVAVFDEAHNIEDAARDHATRTCSEATLTSALDELDETDDFRAEATERVVRSFHDALVDTYEDGLGFGARESLDDDWMDVAIEADTGRDDLTMAFLERYEGPGYKQDLEHALNLGKTLDQAYQEAYKEGETTTRKECQTLAAAGFIDEWMAGSGDPGTYPVVSVRRTEAGVRGRAELYTCIPRQVTEPLFDDLHASVLMSATLRPFDVQREVLGLENPVTMAHGLQFPEERRRTFAVTTPALFASERDDPDVQSTVAGTIEDAVRFTPGNTLVFCPSYAEAERYYDRVGTDATPYLDRPGERAEELREAFTAGDDGVLFTSLWGTLAEGVSYDGDDARTVLVVGVPYPHLDDRMEAVEDAFAGAFGGDEQQGWRYAVEIPTVRKTRQALGRVVRSPADFGVRALVDERYAASRADDLGQYSVHETFPEEEREELVDVAPEKLKFAMLNFYQSLDAYDDAPPRP
ncbi:MAG: ATP-dependent DNA helicase [Haloglomus sp.]